VKLTIPVGPEARRLRFLFNTKSGATPSSGVEEYWDGDINWVTPEDLGKLADRYVRETRRRITEEGYKNCGVSLASAGSIVLSKRAPIGQTAILKTPSTCNQGCFLLTKLDGVDERFYFYSLIHLRSALEALGRGSTFMELSTDDLRSVSMPFPNQEAQCLIANYLDLETARIDGLIAEYGLPSFIKIDVEGYEESVLAGLTMPVPALSFEFTTIERKVALACLDRLSSLGRYGFDLVLGERQQLVFDRWCSAAELADYLHALPHEVNSGDIYGVAEPSSASGVS
jgi:hypothetical protein